MCGRLTGTLLGAQFRVVLVVCGVADSFWTGKFTYFFIVWWRAAENESLHLKDYVVKGINLADLSAFEVDLKEGN